MAFFEMGYSGAGCMVARYPEANEWCPLGPTATAEIGSIYLNFEYMQMLGGIMWSPQVSDSILK